MHLHNAGSWSILHILSVPALSSPGGDVPKFAACLQEQALWCDVGLDSCRVRRCVCKLRTLPRGRPQVMSGSCWSRSGLKNGAQLQVVLQEVDQTYSLMTDVMKLKTVSSLATPQEARHNARRTRWALHTMFQRVESPL